MKKLMVLIVFLMTGCAVKPPKAPTHQERLKSLVTAIKTESVLSIDHQQLLKLPDDEVNRFTQYFLEKPLEKPSYQHLYDYLERRFAYFSYDGATHIAAKSLEYKNGNCLSLAILTVAYAEVANIEYAFDLVTTSPVYLQHQGLDVISNHVRTKLLAPKMEEKNTVFIGRDGVIVDYFPTRNSTVSNPISRDYFISLYYQNRASDALSEGKNEQALMIAKQGAFIAPENVALLNTMAVSLSRLGRTQEAEALYQVALLNFPDKIELLSNYRILAIKNGDQNIVEKLSKRIEASDDPNPFEWLSLGNQSFNNHKYKKALKYYQRAVQLAPYLAKAHQGVGKTHLKLGNLAQAQSAFEFALSNTHDDQLEALYESKLAMIEINLR